MRDFGISPILCSLSRLKELGTLFSASTISSTNNGSNTCGKGDGLGGVPSSSATPLTPVRGGGHGTPSRDSAAMKSTAAPVALSFNSFVKVLLQLADDIYGQQGPFGASNASISSPGGVPAPNTVAEETTTTTNITTTTTMTSSNENPMALVLKVMDRSAGRSKLVGTSYGTSSAPLFVTLV